jgi:hypothetical protein
VFFSRQDDRPGASNGQRAIAAEKGKTRRRFLYARQLPLLGLAGNNPASCREKNTPTPDLIIKIQHIDWMPSVK